MLLFSGDHSPSRAGAASILHAICTLSCPTGNIPRCKRPDSLPAIPRIRPRTVLLLPLRSRSCPFNTRSKKIPVGASASTFTTDDSLLDDLGHLCTRKPPPSLPIQLHLTLSLLGLDHLLFPLSLTPLYLVSELVTNTLVTNARSKPGRALPILRSFQGSRRALVQRPLWALGTLAMFPGK